MSIPGSVNAKHGVTRSNAGFGTHGQCRKSNAFLRHELLRLSLNPAHQAFVGRGTHRFGKLCAPPEAWKCRLDHQFLEVFQNIAAWFFLAAPPRRNRRHAQFLAQQLPAESGQKCHVCAGLHQAAAERVIDRDGTVPHRFHQAWYPEQGISAKFERVAETVVQTTQNHIDRFQTVQRFEIHTAIEHRQIRAFNQREAPLPCQK